MLAISIVCNSDKIAFVFDYYNPSLTSGYIPNPRVYLGYMQAVKLDNKDNISSTSVRQVESVDNKHIKIAYYITRIVRSGCQINEHAINVDIT